MTDNDSDGSASNDNNQVGGWGFSPDGYTFVLSYKTDVSTYSLGLWNLTHNTNAPLVGEFWKDVASFWEFSPCGDLFMWVHQAGGNPSTSDFADFLFTSNGHQYKELHLAPSQGNPSATVVTNSDGTKGIELTGMETASIPSPQCSVSVTAHSPVNITLNDPTGRRTGFDATTGGVLNQIPGSTYTGAGSEPQTVVVPYVPGAFLLDAFGLTSLTSPQPYRLTFASIDRSGDILDQVDVSGMASAGRDDRYAFAIGNGPIAPLQVSKVPLLGDVNGDGVVNCADLAIVKAAFGKKTGQAGFDPRADVNGDGIVNILDLSTVARQLPVGTTCK